MPSTSERGNSVCANLLWISRPKNLRDMYRLFPSVLTEHKWVFDIEALNSTREAVRKRLLGETFNLNEALAAEVSLLAGASVRVAAAALDIQVLQRHGVTITARLGHPVKPRELDTSFHD